MSEFLREKKNQHPTNNSELLFSVVLLVFWVSFSLFVFYFDVGGCHCLRVRRNVGMKFWMGCFSESLIFFLCLAT